MTITDEMQIREPSFTFSFSGDAECWDLPTACTPTGESAALGSLFGLLSREQSMEHISGFNLDLLDPVFNETTTSTDESNAQAIVMDSSSRSWSEDLKELFDGDRSMNSPEPEHEEASRPSLKHKLEEEEHDETSEQEPEAKRRRTPVEAPQTGRRGVHMRVRPELHQNARNAQQHWAQKVVELRSEWQQKRMWEQHDQFQDQIQMCSRLHIKSQHECLLRQLQLALVDNLIHLPANKQFTSDTECSFLGWTGFEVTPTRGAEFRRRIEEMFATPPKDKTLNNTLRRAGLVPQGGWGEAWHGMCAFVFDQDKRVRYHHDGGKQEAEAEASF